ncbi:MAG TPA: FIST C-terminal domain-containing protein [Solirubrobacteraceae bacterium]|nr:FIST C-terminal domain-containing protein [Solirubrobacteraceae bacterium]
MKPTNPSAKRGQDCLLASISSTELQALTSFVGTASSAALVLISTPLPFTTFKTQHFVNSDQRVVVTSADPDQRIVTEIDGLPAAEEYAQVVGADAQSLDPVRFAAQPVVVVINGMDYARSIQKVNADGSMTFFCAIDEGLVLRTAQCGDLVGNLEQAFAGIRGEIGEPLVVIGFDCILRKLEIVQQGLVDQVQALMGANTVVGFNTYGEQYRGIHVNQTVTGIAIGRPRNA